MYKPLVYIKNSKAIMKKVVYIMITLIFLNCQKEEFEILGTTDSFTITSTSVNVDFKIYIYLPPNYPQQNLEYPLIIGLDGDTEFENMAAIVSQKIKNGNIPPSIFVGIGYVGGDDDESNRNRDYTPSVTQDIEDGVTGGAGNFYDFIRTELIPELENNYQIDTTKTKTLMGHSYGGLFTLFVMFQERATNPFDKFIPVASSFWYDSGVIFEFEETYSQINSDFPVSVYTTMGSLEGAVMVASFKEMNARINSRHYSSLKYRSEILKKYGHSRSDYISYKNGLDYVFNN